MSVILPKGIVVNTPGISNDIQSKDREPLAPDEIAKLWKVYTTTSRRLLDPTAERLENLWWRIWGSQKRDLKGSIVARLFSEISDGQTFIPLKGPPNRYEGSSTWEGTASELGHPEAHHGQQEDKFSRPTDGRTDRDSLRAVIRDGTVRESPSGASNYSNYSNTSVPAPPPILKKSRNTSSSGPRPTARFISPTTSEDETVQALEPATPSDPSSLAGTSKETSRPSTLPKKLLPFNNDRAKKGANLEPTTRSSNPQILKIGEDDILFGRQVPGQQSERREQHRESAPHGQTPSNISHSTAQFQGASTAYLPGRHKSSDSIVRGRRGQSTISEQQVWDPSDSRLSRFGSTSEKLNLGGSTFRVSTEQETSPTDQETPENGILFKKRPVSPFNKDSSSSFLDATNPSASQSGASIGRSKSQLTLLLQNDFSQENQENQNTNNKNS